MPLEQFSSEFLQLRKALLEGPEFLTEVLEEMIDLSVNKLLQEVIRLDRSSLPGSRSPQLLPPNALISLAKVLAQDGVLSRWRRFRIDSLFGSLCKDQARSQARIKAASSKR